MTDVCIEASVVAMASAEPTEVDFNLRGEEYTVSVVEGAIRAGSCFFVSRGDVTVLRAIWDLGRRQTANASLTAAGAALFTLHEAMMLLVVAERAMGEELSEIER